MPENAIDPGLTIYDPHHHLYDTEFVGQERYTIDDFERDISGGHNIASSVYVETSGSPFYEHGPHELQPVGETEWVATQARGRVIEGIVGYADLLLGNAVAPVLEAHEAATQGRFRGVRFRWLASRGYPEPSPDFLEQGAFQAGWKELHDRELSLELWLKYDQAERIAACARAFPDRTLILGHLGMPSVIDLRTFAMPTPEQWARRDEMLESWRRGMRTIAACENVLLKIGGIGMPFLTNASEFDSPPSSEQLAAYWGPEIRFAIEQFGAERCMFESNWPADQHLCDYTTLWNVYKRITADASETEKSALFHRTAARAYRLGD